ncbi:MAG: hypothetical protein VB143_08330 [Burkholderia sp.]
MNKGTTSSSRLICATTPPSLPPPIAWLVCAPSPSRLDCVVRDARTPGPDGADSPDIDAA